MAKKKLTPDPVKLMQMEQLTQTALRFHQSGNLSQARQNYQQILKIDPNNAIANHYLGVIAHQSGNNTLAERLIRKALSASPNLSQAYNNLGIVLKEQGKLKEAKENYLKLLTIKPDYVEAYSNLGVIHSELGETDQAISCFSRAIQLNPRQVNAHNSLGITYRSMNKVDDAIACYQKAIALAPDYAEAHNNLGNALCDKGDLDSAIASFKRALKINPNYAEAHSNLGNVYEKKGLLDDAKNCFNRAIKIQPSHPEFLFNFGHNFHERGQYSDAYDYYQKVLKLDPNHVIAHSNLLYLMNYTPEYSNQQIFKQHSEWEKQVIANRPTNRPKARRTLSIENRRIKVAYLSPDFRKHSVSYFFAPLLQYHDTERFEIYCYYNRTEEDSTTESLKHQAEHWCNIAKASDIDVVNQIRDDNIDILVDLAGHTSENRLTIFTYRAAPIQVTWLGYPNTTGLSQMDYRLTDEQADPHNVSDPFYSEKLVRLPHGFLCYQGDVTLDHSRELPSDKNGYITFGSFNNLTKVTPEVITLWADILKAVPGAKLLLKSKQLLNEGTKTEILAQFKHLGIESKRIILKAKVDGYQEHLEVYNQVDIGLDTFPYNGTTTTLEALWMGVPMITLCGDRHAARVGSSIMHRIQLDNLVAADPISYVNKAQSLANDKVCLQSLRTELRCRVRDSDLCNAPQFAQDVEQSYQAMIAAHSDHCSKG